MRLQGFLSLVVCLFVFWGATAAYAESYYNFSIDEDALVGAPDQSALNSPIGPEDRIFVRDTHFYRVGPDLKAGTADDVRIRLFGVNLSFAANFPTEAEASKIARRIRKLGFNAVRLHHMDSAPDSQPNSARSLLTDGPFPTLNPLAVTRLKTFIAALKQEGIYINLNLHVGYRFRPQLDAVPPLYSSGEPLPMSGPMHVFHPRLLNLQVEYAQKVIRSLNLQADPVLAMVEINNESSLASTWQAWDMSRWDQLIQGAYAEELKQQWNDWIVRKYASIKHACEAWRSCDTRSPLALISPKETLPSVPDNMQKVVRRISRVWDSTQDWVKNKVGRQGKPASESDSSQVRLLDFMDFVATTDKAYVERMAMALRNDLGPLVPITGTQTSYGGPLNFTSHAGMSYTDEHFYHDHYIFPNTDWDSNDWKIRNTSLSGKALSNLLAVGLARDSSKPFVVSEFNQPYPNQQRAEILPIVAAIAAQQDWDGLFFFDYADGATWKKTPSSFTLSGDWGKVVLVGQAARIFRESLIPASPERLWVPLGAKEQLVLAARHDGNAIRRLATETYGLDLFVALSGQLAIDASGQSKATQLNLPAPATRGPIRRDPLQNTLLLQSEQVVGFFGYPQKGEPMDAGAASLMLASSSRGFVSALLSSLDGKPIRQAGRLLFSMPGDLLGTQPGAIPRRPKRIAHYAGQADWWTLEPDPGKQDKPSGARDALGPLWMEQIESRLVLLTEARTLTVYPLDGSGQRQIPLSSELVRPVVGGFEIALHVDRQKLSPWYEIVVDPASTAQATQERKR